MGRTRQALTAEEHIAVAAERVAGRSPGPLGWEVQQLDAQTSLLFAVVGLLQRIEGRLQALEQRAAAHQ